MALSDVLKSQKRALETERDTLNKRVRELKSIRTSILSCCDGEITGINGTVDAAASDIGDGLTGISSAGGITSALQGMKQKGSGSDTRMSGTKGSIDSEITRCENEISSLNTEISQKSSSIRTALKNEREAAAQKN